MSFRNLSPQPISTEVLLQVFQASPPLAVPIPALAIRKPITLSPGQRVIESIEIDLPAVRAQTQFIVRVRQPAGVPGHFELWAYPSNRLSELRSLLGGRPLWLANPAPTWKEALQAAGIEAREAGWLEDARLPDPPSLALLNAPTLAASGAVPSEWTRLLADAVHRVKAGAAVICVESTSAAMQTEPSYYPVPLGRGVWVVAQPFTLKNLATDPWSQERLLAMARLATGSAQLHVPGITP
jgi:hypothetical protein